MPRTTRKSVDISVNVIFHKEGILAHKTLRSILAGIKFAHKHGINTELNISFDNIDGLTKSSVKRVLANDSQGIKCHILELSLGDAGLCRNALADVSNGKYLSFFDGDDFFTENYLTEAFKLAEKNGEVAIYSPRYLIVFEGDHYLVEKRDSNGFENLSRNMIETNYHISQLFMHRDVFKKVRYEVNGPGFGMEDWLFNCNALAEGIKFYNVPETIFFYRKKRAGGMLAVHTLSMAMTRPSKLFDPKTYAMLPATGFELRKTSVEKRRGLREVVRPVKRHEFAYHYFKTQYNLHRHFGHVVQQRIKRDGSTPALTGVARLDAIGITPKLIDYWGKLNRFEPMIRASWDMLEHIPIVSDPTESLISDVYYRLCKRAAGHSITDVVLVPHLTRGGADKAAINLIKELDAKTAGKVLVISTVDVASPWKDKVTSLRNTIFIEGASELTSMDDARRIAFTLKVIQHFGVERLTIINSEIGYKIATHFSSVVKEQGCKIYLHTYAFNMTDDGFLFNVLQNGLVDAYSGVDTFITDSKGYADELVEINGFEPSKVKVLYSPVDIKPVQKKNFKRTNKILWAGRVGDDKLANVLLEIGKLSANENFSIDVYGDVDDAYAGMFTDAALQSSAITYKGSFSNFNQLPLDDYDMLLMTTKNEGMPFIILEACASGIFIVAPEVGGIGDCVTVSKNGLFVENKLDALSYIDAIHRTYKAKDYLNGSVIKKYGHKVGKRHGQDNYSNMVAELMLDTTRENH